MLDSASLPILQLQPSDRRETPGIKLGRQKQLAWLLRDVALESLKQ